MRVWFTSRARAQVLAADRWWRGNRSAVDLFLDELEGAIGALETTPLLGAEAPDPCLAGVRRLLLSGCGYHLYYRVLADRVQVLAVWHCKRLPPRRL